MISRIARALALLLLTATPLFAWGEKGHSLVNEAATFETPNAMPSFFHAAYPSLVYLGYEPDRWRSAGPAVDDALSADHFLDSEYVADLELPPARHDYITRLFESGTLRRYGIGVDAPGFLPWRITEVTLLLEHQFRLWRSSQNVAERKQIEANIIHYAGILGHYAGDAANPHHATIHHNGWVRENPKGYRIDCDSHSRFESQFVARAIRLRDVLPHMRERTLRTDYFGAALEMVRRSYALVEPLYELDRDGGFDRRGTVESRTFAGDRLAAGASFLRDLWWSAYENSKKRPPRD